MFIGHFALGYAAKRWVPHLSLAVLFAAAQLADLLWPVLVAAGIEQVRIVPAKLGADAGWMGAARLTLSFPPR